MIAFFCLLLAAAAYAAVRRFEWTHTFKPQGKMEGDPSLIGVAFEDVIFFAEDGKRLHGWWVAHPEARGTILYCHGNAGNISTRLDVIEGLHGLGVNLFIFDYRGYGLSKGIPTEQGLYRDARAAYEVVRAKYNDEDDPPVMVFGSSLGAAVAAQLAADKPVRGIIIEGGFTSAIDVGERWYPNLPVSMIARYRFDARAKLCSLPQPKLFAHSATDKVIPYDLGGELFQSAAPPKHFVPLNGEHGEACWRDTPVFYAELKKFVASVMQ
jgi:uncharacterized protein